MKAPNEKILKYNKGMKFDCIVSNAPYNNGLHEKFEAKYFDICKGEIVWVSPLSFLLGKKQKTKITHQLDKYICDIEQINGNEYFDANICGTMGITYVNMNKDIIHNSTYIIFDGKKYNKCNGISPTSNDELLTKFKSIIENLCNNNLEQHLYAVPNAIKWKKYINNPNPNWWCIKISAIRGHVSHNGFNDDFFTIISNNKKEIQTYIFGQYKDLVKQKKNDKNTFNYYFYFNNKNECVGLLHYLMTDFCRTCYYLVKINTNVFNGGEFKHIPWFDFSNDIFNKTPAEIDDYLFAKYNISDDIRKHIEELLPDFYNIRKGRD